MTNGENRKQIEGTDRIFFEPLRAVGASIEFTPTSLPCLKNKISYYLKDIKIKRMKYVDLGGGTYKVTRIY